MSWVICWKHPLLTVSKCLKLEREPQSKGVVPSPWLTTRCSHCKLKLWAPLVSGRLPLSFFFGHWLFTFLFCRVLGEQLFWHRHFIIPYFNVPYSCLSLFQPMAATGAPRRWPHTSRCSIWVVSVKWHQNNPSVKIKAWKWNVLASFPRETLIPNKKKKAE